MEEELREIKPIIRSILLALGRRATEREFRKEYFDVDGESFNEVLKKHRASSFYQFMRSIPDVCRVWQVGDEIYIERVSCEETSHMDQLTIVKKRKRPKLIPRFGLG
jgi:hypothetical protein